MDSTIASDTLINLTDARSHPHSLSKSSAEVAGNAFRGEN